MFERLYMIDDGVGRDGSPPQHMSNPIERQLTCSEYIKGDRFSPEFVEKRRME